MEKIYGFREQDIKSLAKLLKENKGVSPTKIFNEYSLKSGKSKGTVRNMYYALAKKSREDENFRNECLDGEIISVGKITPFTEKDESDVIKQILTLKSQGLSVRKAVERLADGDSKKALRLQNKYRTVLTNKPQLVHNIASSIQNCQPYSRVANGIENDLPKIPEVQFIRLKREINNLVGKISLKERRENDFLKKRIAELEIENSKLSVMLFGSQKNKAIKYFSRNSATHDLTI